MNGSRADLLDNLGKLLVIDNLERVPRCIGLFDRNPAASNKSFIWKVQFFKCV